jgi:acyl-CoA synthetase (AMP-forming)/AMP-acid ligase II
MSLEIDSGTLIAPERTPAIVHGSSSVPLLDLTLSELLDFQCTRYGSRECVVIPWTGARWTYHFLRQESISLSKGLLERGIQPGDRVAIMAGNCEQYVSIFFACMRIGVILVILNNTYTAPEASYALEFTGTVVLPIDTISRRLTKNRMQDALYNTQNRPP